MDARHLVRGVFRSQWTQFFGLALIVVELFPVAAGTVTGDWSLTWVFPLLIVLILLRFVFIGLLFFGPVLIAVIIVWAVYTYSKEKKKANRETSTGKATTTSDRVQ